MNQKYYWTLLFFFLILSITSCFDDKGKNIPDVSNINVEVDIKDFHYDLFAIDTNDIQSGIVNLQKKYPAFFDLYFLEIVPLLNNKLSEADFLNNVKGFLSDADVRKLADTTAIVYPNLNRYKDKFEHAFQLYQYYFPNKPIPKIYPMISGFNYASFIFPISENQDGLGVGLDMLLGNDYPYWQLGIQNPAFSNYITRSFTPEHLVKKTIDPLVDDLVEIPKGDRLLDLMIYNGKKLFLLEKLLPLTPDSVKWEYSAPQTEWILQNEFLIYDYLIKQDLIYETSTNKIKKLVDQSPSSPGMPKEAPGRTANFIGYRMIQSFMRKNKEVSVAEMIQLDAQKILDKAKYKPRL